MVDPNLVFSLSGRGHDVVTYAPVDRLRLSGFARPGSLERLAGTPCPVEEPRRRGRLVMMPGPSFGHTGPDRGSP